MKKKKLVLGLLVLMLLFIGIKYCAGQTSAGKLKLTPLQEFMSGLKGQQAHSPRQRLGYQDIRSRPVGA